MPSIELSENMALGRAVLAARNLLGLDQTQLGALAKVSGGTISNVENGKESREATLAAVRKALRRKGATLALDYTNGRIILALNFYNPDDDEV